MGNSETAVYVSSKSGGAKIELMFFFLSFTFNEVSITSTVTDYLASRYTVYKQETL